VNKTYVIAGIAVAAITGAVAMAVRGRERREREPEAAREEVNARYLDMRPDQSQAREDAQAAAIVRVLVGDRPGQPGSLFDGFRFGSAGISVSTEDRARAAEAAKRAGVQLVIEPWQLTAEVHDDAAIPIYRRWNAAPRQRTFLDPTTNAALTVEERPAWMRLVWTPYETPAHLIDPGDDRPLGSTPFSVVGAKVAALSAAVGDKLQPAGHGHYTWQLPPLEHGWSMEAALDTSGGTITRVTLQLMGKADDLDRAVHAIYGDAAAMGRSWKHGALEITIDANGRATAKRAK